MGQESLLTQFHLSASEFKRWLPQFYSLDGPWQGTRMGAVGINMRAGVRSCHLGISNSCKLIFKECWCTFISSAALGKASFFFILSFSYERFFTEGLNTSLVFSLIALPLSSKLLAIQSFSQRAEMLSPALLPTEASKEVQRANSKRKSQALLGISSLDLVWEDRNIQVDRQSLFFSDTQCISDLEE